MSEDGTCAWSGEGDGSNLWGSGCGEVFLLNEGTPTDNGMKWCCFCGRKLAAFIGEEKV